MIIITLDGFVARIYIISLHLNKSNRNSDQWKHNLNVKKTVKFPIAAEKRGEKKSADAYLRFFTVQLRPTQSLYEQQSFVSRKLCIPFFSKAVYRLSLH